jgi:hypothetical protein
MTERREASSGELPIVSVPGSYRADVLIAGKPIWRSFVRITPWTGMKSVSKTTRVPGNETRHHPCQEPDQ